MKQKSVLLTIAVLLGLRIAATAQTPPSYVPTDGLVGWWPFNGNANDESGNGNNGTVNGATLTEDRFGNSSLAYSFDGISDFIQINDNPTLDIESSLTMSVWSKYSSTCSNCSGWILGKGINSTNSGYLIGEGLSYNQNGSDGYRFIGGSIGIQPWEGHTQSNEIIGTTWNHVVIVFDILNLKIYVNGLLDTTYISDYTLSINDAPLLFGAINDNPTAGHYAGEIDDAGIWNRALTPEEIAGLYNAAECTHDLTLAPENSVSNLGSTVSFSANTSDVNPVYTWQTDFGQGFQNVVDYGNYSGASTSTLTISDLQLNNHNQPLRVISTSGICVDTSEVAFISLADTCITHVFDTTYITVTDTLIININPTGFNPLTYANTILMYPNPASDQLTINYGDFASLAGYSLKIFNSIGQEIHSANISQQQEVLQLTTWGGAGTYEVVIYNAQGVPVETRAIVLE